MVELTLAEVEAVVKKLKPFPDFKVTEWHMRRTTDGGGDAYDTGLLGVYRLWGAGQRSGQSEPWSLFLKAFSSSSDSGDPASLYYWRREEQVYKSELALDRSSGICMPRLLASTFPSPNECWLWLEDIQDVFDNRWPLAHYAEVGRQFGMWNARHLNVDIKTHYPWASNGRRQTWLAICEDLVSNLDRYPKDGLLGRWLRQIGRERLLALWDQRRQFQDILAALPQTFCHHDAFKRNLFARRLPDGEYETVAIDWAFAGKGVIGEDIATLIPISVTFGEVPMAQLLHLDDLVFAGYLAGLRAADCTSDEDIVRLGYSLSAVVTHLLGSLWFIVPGFSGGELERVIETVLGCPIGVVYDRWTPVHEYLFDLADQGLSLAERLGFAH